MAKTSAPEAVRSNSGHKKKMAARLMAVQAVYEAGHNGEPFEQVLRDYIDNRSGMEIGDRKIEEPDQELFLSTARAVQNRREEVTRILEASTSSKNPDPDQPRKEVEPLLRAILLCGIAEILQHADIDPPLIINDYIEVTRAFYDKGEIALVNGVLDSVVGILRA